MLEKESGKVVLLTARVSADDPVAPGSSIDYINDVAVASNSIVYFTDSVRGITPAKNPGGFWDTMAAYTLSLFNVSAPFLGHLITTDQRDTDACRTRQAVAVTALSVRQGNRLGKKEAPAVQGVSHRVCFIFGGVKASGLRCRGGHQGGCCRTIRRRARHTWSARASGLPMA